MASHPDCNARWSGGVHEAIEAQGSQDVVLADLDRDVLTLTLNRPERLNAWTQALEDRYFDLLATADRDPQVRAVVVTGAGRGFCAGADLAQLEAVGAGTERYTAGRRHKTFPMTVRKPLIAAINGACAGLGLVQALYCDVRFVASDAKLTTAFARRGVIAEHGISWMLPRLVGPARALDLLLSSRVVLGAEAAAVGLAQFASVPGDTLADATAYARDLAAHCSPRSVAVMKHQVSRHLDVDFDTASAEADELMVQSFSWPDLKEGVASYNERRDPDFPPLGRDPFSKPSS